MDLGAKQRDGNLSIWMVVYGPWLVRYNLGPFAPPFTEAHHVPTLCQRYPCWAAIMSQAFYMLVLQQSGKVDPLPLYRREPLTLVSHDSMTSSPPVLICAELGRASMFHLQWFILWNWRCVRNFNRCNIYLSVPLREREMVSIFNLGKLMFSLCEKDSSCQKAGELVLGARVIR